MINSWTLKGISGHMMGLEGICWNVPVRIGGIEFLHNFFITRMDLGNKDMVLGQPWLFSHSMRIDYVHDMGVTVMVCLVHMPPTISNHLRLHLPTLWHHSNAHCISLHNHATPVAGLNSDQCLISPDLVPMSRAATYLSFSPYATFA